MPLLLPPKFWELKGYTTIPGRFVTILIFLFKISLYKRIIGAKEMAQQVKNLLLLQMIQAQSLALTTAV